MELAFAESQHCGLRLGVRVAASQTSDPIADLLVSPAGDGGLGTRGCCFGTGMPPLTMAVLPLGSP